MIKDNIRNIERYIINEPFEEFKRLLLSKETFPVQLEPPLKAILLEFTSKGLDLTKFENHQRYIDIHLLLEGSELIGLNCQQQLKASMDYDEENDYQLFEGELEETIILKPGDFLILFPDEIHVTGGVVQDSEEVKKIVYKIPFTT